MVNNNTSAKNLSSTADVSEPLKAAINSLVAAFLHLTAHLTAIPALCSHIEQIIKEREQKAPWMLPEYNLDTTDSFRKFPFEPPSPKKSEEVKDDLFFNKALVIEALRSTGHNTTNLLKPFVCGNTGVFVSSSLQYLFSFRTEN